MSKTQKSQLPIGGEIDHNGRALRIEKLLTEKGLTSRVYEGWLDSEDQSGQIRVAIKAMKPLDFPLARQAFQQEGATLASMMHYETEANQEQRLNLKIAPVYHGNGVYNDVPYLVMEFISGQEIPDLMIEKGEKLPESQALTIAWHLFRTLDLLHIHLKCSYADLKYENMWWMDGDKKSNGQLKLLDFGNLEEINSEEFRRYQSEDDPPRGVRRDLLQAGVYMCHMLTGHMPNYSMAGHLKERAEPIIRQAEMSWGARQLLFLLLHRNPQARPTSASFLASKVRILVNFWTSPLEKVLDTAQNLLVKAETSDESKHTEARELATTARSALDIAYLRNPGDEHLTDDIERAEKMLAISGYLNRGKTLLQTRSPDIARKIFEEGMHWSNEPGKLRRWSYLARVGEDISSTVFDEHCQAAMQMVEWMNEEDWHHAMERLEQLRPNLQASGMDMLYADINMSRQIAAAEIARNEKNYAEAARALREAMRWLEELPDADFIQDEEEGDLYLLVKEMEHLQETEGAAKASISEAESLLHEMKPDWELILQKVSQALALDRENSNLLEILYRIVESSLQRYNFSFARKLAWKGLQRDLSNEKLSDYYYISEYLLEAERALNRRSKEDFWGSLRRVQSAFGPNLTIEPAITHLRERAAEVAAEVEDVDWLRKLAQLANEQGDWDQAEVWQAEAQRLANQRESHLRKVIDKLVSDATALWQIDELTPNEADMLVDRYTANEMTAHLQQRQNRLKQAYEFIVDAERIAEETNYRQDDIESLRDRVNASLKIVSKQTENREQNIEAERQARLEKIDRLWEELKHFLKWGQDGTSKGARGLVLNSVAQQAEEDAKELVRQCHVYLTTLDASNEHIRKLLNDIYQEVDKLGLKGWRSIRQLADEHTAKINEEFQQAHLAFEQGDAALAAAEVERLAADFSLTPEWMDLKTRLGQVTMWQSWQEENQGFFEAGELDACLLKTLRDFVAQAFPSVYYQKAEEYLQRAHLTAKDYIKAQLHQSESYDFAHTIRLWMDVELTRRMLRRNYTQG